MSAVGGTVRHERTRFQANASPSEAARSCSGRHRGLSHWSWAPAGARRTSWANVADLRQRTSPVPGPRGPRPRRSPAHGPSARRAHAGAGPAPLLRSRRSHARRRVAAALLDARPHERLRRLSPEYGPGSVVLIEDHITTRRHPAHGCELRRPDGPLLVASTRHRPHRPPLPGRHVNQRPSRDARRGADGEDLAATSSGIDRTRAIAAPVWTHGPSLTNLAGPGTPLSQESRPAGRAAHRLLAQIVTRSQRTDMTRSRAPSLRIRRGHRPSWIRTTRTPPPAQS